MKAGLGVQGVHILFKVASVQGAAAEARLKAAGTYGGPAYQPPTAANPPHHQHFGPIVVSCERADLRPVPDGVWVYADERRELLHLPAPPLPRYEVIDELCAAVVDGSVPLHDGAWGRSTLEVCLALLRSTREGRDVRLPL